MVKPPKKNLGKGLSALLGNDGKIISDSRVQKPSRNRDISSNNHLLSVEKMHPGRFQPRQKFSSPEIEELAKSIKMHGIIQPILVRKHPKKKNNYEIIAGERRWRAAQVAQVHEVPVIFREFSDGEALEIGLVENLQRENLSTLEEAEGYRRLVDEFGHTQEEIAKTLGKSRPYVSNMIRLLNLPGVIKEMLQKGDLTVGHARALLNTENPIGLAEKVVARGLNVRQTEILCKTSDPQVEKEISQKTPLSKDPDILSLEKDLIRSLGLKVEIDFNMGGGNIKISYENLEQLDGVLYSLSNGKHGKRYFFEDTD